MQHRTQLASSPLWAPVASLLFCAPLLAADDRIAPGGVDAPPNQASQALTSDFDESGAPNEEFFLFTYDDSNDVIEYKVTLEAGTAAGDRVRDGAVEVLARVNGGAWFTPISDGGVRYRQDVESGPGTNDEVILEPDAFRALADTTLVWPPTILNNRAVDLHYVDTITESTGGTSQSVLVLRRKHRFSLSGSTLKIEITDDGTWTYEDGKGSAVRYYCGFSPGTAENTLSAHDYTVPYSRYPAAVWTDGTQEIFYGAYTDPVSSNTLVFLPYRNPAGADALSVGMITKSVEDTNDEVEAFSEAVYVAVDTDLLDVIPRAEVAVDPGTLRDDLDKRVVMDIVFQQGFQEFGGSELAWRTPTRGAATIEVDYSAGLFPLAPGEGLRFEVRHRKASAPNAPILLHDEYLTDANVRTWTGSAALRAGDEILFRIDPAGIGNEQAIASDSLTLSPRVTHAGVVHDAALEFSTIQQGQNGWYYRSYFETTTADMVYDADPAVDAWIGTDPGMFQWGRIDDGELLNGNPALLMKPTAWYSRVWGQWFQRMHDAGMRDIAAIIHYWQKHSFDQELPDQHPQGSFTSANGLATQDMIDMVDLGKSLGFQVALHENYSLVTDDSVWYLYAQNEDALQVKDKHGVVKLIAGTGNSNLSSDRMAWAFDNEVNDANDPILYSPNACYLDNNTPGYPWPYMNMDAASNPNPKTSAEAFQGTFGLFDSVAAHYAGPVFGEGGDLFVTRFGGYYAGHMHAQRRDMFERYLGYTIPDFELNEVRPLMVGQGMGKYLWRFAPFTGPSFPDFEYYDDYFIFQTLLYGHAGWLDPQLWEFNLGKIVQHYADVYYRVRAVQERTLDRSDAVTGITYDVGTPSGTVSLDIDTAAAQSAAGVSLSNAHITVDYASGLKVQGNFDTGNPRAVTVSDYASVQPHLGWTRVEELPPVGGGSPTWASLEYEPLEDLFLNSEGGWMTEDGVAPKWASDTRMAYEYEVPATGDYAAQIYYARTQDYNIDTLPGYPAGAFPDGAILSIEVNGTTVFSVDSYPNAGTLPSSNQIIKTQPISVGTLTAGDKIYVVFDPKNNTYDDVASFFSAVIERTDTPYATTWQVSSGGSTYDLPYLGTLVTASTPALLAFSGDATGERIDYVDAEDYEYLRSRSGNTVSYGSLATDGSVALVPEAVTGLGTRDEVHLFGGTHVDKNSLALLTLSQNAHCHVLWDEAAGNRIEVLPNFTAAGSTVDVTYTGLPMISTGTLTEHDPAGPSTALTNMTDFTIVNGVLTITGARPGWTYEFTW